MLRRFFDYHFFRLVRLLQKISNRCNSDSIVLPVSLSSFPGINSPPIIFLKPRQGHAMANPLQGSFPGPESRWSKLPSLTLGASLMMP